MASKPKKSKRFTYNLASVLKVRNIRVIQAQEALDAARRQLKEEIRKEKEIKEYQNKMYKECREKMEAGAVLNDAMLADINRRKVHMDQLKEKVEAQIKKREDAEKAVEDRRLKLVKAAMDKKVLEKTKRKSVLFGKIHGQRRPEIFG